MFHSNILCTPLKKLYLKKYNILHNYSIATESLTASKNPSSNYTVKTQGSRNIDTRTKESSRFYLPARILDKISQTAYYLL